MVNVHSHAFQRGLRGQVDRFPRGAGSFWTWREAMYELATKIDTDGFARLCHQAFREMLASGITTVGEFHYLHHSGPVNNYAFDELVLQAADEVGIRLVLLYASYETGGLGQPLDPGQRRFTTRSSDEYWRQLDRLADQLTVRQSLGIAAHSVRAVPLEQIRILHEEAKRRGLPFHMHIEETKREVEECLAFHGKTPLGLVNDELELDANLTAVHCTHSRPEDLARFLDHGGRVCICPLTEANLGDGLPAIEVGAARNHEYLSVGTDCNARICLNEELRWLEYGQRLRRETRGIFTDVEGDVAATLFDVGTRGGAAALFLEAGAIRPGAWADFLTIDLAHPAVLPAAPDDLMAAFVLGTGTEAIDQVCVGGRWQDARQ
jgi:formimidoylglutamate deiminase